MSITSGREENPEVSMCGPEGVVTEEIKLVARSLSGRAGSGKGGKVSLTRWKTGGAVG